MSQAVKRSCCEPIESKGANATMMQQTKLFPKIRFFV